MGASSRQEREEDLHAELGYRTAGHREVSLREWFSLRGEKDEPLPTPKAFAVAVNRLRALKWARENRERHYANIARYQAQPRVRARSNEKQTERRRERYGARPDVLFSCEECGVQWCKTPWVRGPRRRFCGQNCQKRARNRVLRGEP